LYTIYNQCFSVSASVRPRIKIWEVFGTKAALPTYDGPECDRPYPNLILPTRQHYNTPGNRIGPYTLGGSSMTLIRGKDQVNDDGEVTRMEPGWTDVVLYGGTLETLGPVFQLTAIAAAGLIMDADAKKHKSEYQNGEYLTHAHLFLCVCVYSRIRSCHAMFVSYEICHRRFGDLTTKIHKDSQFL
jgi:hypothetical protein